MRQTPPELFSLLWWISFLGNLQVIRRCSKSFRQQFDLRTGERNTQKPLRNAMFVFNPFFSHCSHCLTSIERGRSGGSAPLANLTEWQLPARHSWTSPCPCHFIPLAPLLIPHCISVVCAVCFILCLFFCFLFFSLLQIEAKWSETSHHADALHSFPLLLIECLPEQQQQLLLLSNEWNAIKLMSMHVYSV